MFYQKVSTYFNYYYEYFNNKLEIPAKLVQNKLSINSDYLPGFLSKPVNFFSGMFSFFLFVISFMNSTLCILASLFYPLYYSMETMASNTIDLDRLLTVSKYWTVLSLSTVLYSLFGFVFRLFPGYNYVRLLFVYLLVRNEFLLSNRIYDMIKSVYLNYRDRYWQLYPTNSDVPMESATSVSVKETMDNDDLSTNNQNSTYFGSLENNHVNNTTDLNQ